MNGWLLPTVSLIAVATVILVALSMGYNGAILGGGLSLIAGLGGYAAGKRKK